MMKHTYITIFLLAGLFLFSCGEKKNEDAIRYLDSIKSLYNQGNYPEALQKIDSIQKLFPKAFDEIKEGLALKQEVRKASDLRQVAESDSLLSLYELQIDSIKKLFIYQKDKEDVTGVFIPKVTNSNHITATVLRSGVNEDGSMYVESVYVGGKFHNQITVANKDKKTAESLPVDDDGFNFRFSNLGTQYEVVRVTPVHDNGLAKFIADNSANSITVTLKGKNTTSYPLSNIHRKAIADSYNFSSLLHKKDSLIEVKDKAEIRLQYLESKTQDNSNKESESVITE